MRKSKQKSTLLDLFWIHLKRDAKTHILHLATIRVFSRLPSTFLSCARMSFCVTHFSCRVLLYCIDSMSWVRLFLSSLFYFCQLVPVLVLWYDCDTLVPDEPAL